LDRTGSGGSLRVLLVSAVEAARNEVAALLERWPGEARLYWVSQPNLAAARGQDLVPHVVLIDSELDGTDPLRLVRQMVSLLPSAAVIALVEWDAMTRASQAVLAGARAFLVKPLQADEFLATMRQVTAEEGSGAEEIAAGASLGEVVVFCAPKGGTGRTTLAINAAVALREASGQEVALVDADFASPALDVALNLPAEHNILDLLPRLARLDRDLLHSILATHASGLRVLLAPPPGEALDPISLPQVEQILVILRAMFPWVVVDLGLPLDEMAFAFLDGADRIVMNVLPEMVGLRNTRLMLDQLRARGYPEERIWMVLTRANMKGGVALEDIERRLKVRVRVQIADDQPLVTHSVNVGVPLSVSHPRSALAKGFRSLADMLVASAAPVPEANPSPARGVLGRLFGGAG
jgi:pilus assembly protein CpaE